MKLIHFADLHIGIENYGKTDPKTGFSTRLLDFLKTFDFLVDYAIKNKVDAVLFAGDAYKNREPTQTHQREFAKRILKLTKNKIPVVLLVGNHDTPNVQTKANALDIYSTLEVADVQVIRSPEIRKISLNSGQTLQIVGLPWLSKKDYQNLADTLRSFYEQLEKGLPTITLLHGTVEGSVYGSEKNITLGKDLIVPLSLLTSPKVSYVALGHIHKRQVLSQNPPVIYSGSLERVDFGEKDEEKSFELVEIDKNNRASHQPILVPARPFVELEFDLISESIDPHQEILSRLEKADLKEAILKIVLNISSENLETVQITKVKKRAEEKAYHLAGITKNIERSVRQRLEGVSAEELSPLEALRKYFEVKKYPERQIKKLEKTAEKLIL